MSNRNKLLAELNIARDTWKERFEQFKVGLLSAQEIGPYWKAYVEATLAYVKG